MQGEGGKKLHSKGKKKYKEMLKQKDIQIRELNESLLRAKEDISALQTIRFD